MGHSNGINGKLHDGLASHANNQTNGYTNDHAGEQGNGYQATRVDSLNNIVEFLNDLAVRGISLTADASDQLQIHARKDALTPPLVSTLKQHKSELIAWLRERKAIETGTVHSYPLTQGQLGLWLDWQLDPQSSRYHLVSVDCLPADLCLDTLRQAAQMLLDRHPVLRTIYPMPDEQTATQPVQQVQAGQVVDFTIVDGTTWTQTQVDAWIKVTADRPFNLSTGPIMRMVVLRTLDAQGRDVQLLHWTIHHIATDYFTQEILRQELATCYQALRQGSQPAPPGQAPGGDLTYHDFVRWEQDMLREQGEQLAAFWQTYLGNSVPLLELPTLPQHRLAQTHTAPMQSKTVSFPFAPQLVAQLRALARAHQTTLYTVLLAAYEVLIHRYTEQENFLIVSPTAVRTLPGWSNTVGYFVNPLLLRTDLAGNPSFAALLQRTHQNYNRVLQHQMYPYPDMIRHLQKQVAATQLSQAMVGFVFVSLRQPTREVALLETIASEQRGMSQALTLAIFENADELNGLITYHADRFDRATIARMVGHLQTLLAGIAADPAQPIRTLPLLTPAERQQLPVEWNDTTTAYPKEKCIHQLFEEQVECTPDAVAVVMENQRPETRDQRLEIRDGVYKSPVSSLQSLTYAELNARANQLAHYLQALGVGPETLVAICVERSLEMVVGLLGILKAGGAYLPLDPTYPKERLAFMLEDAAVSVLLTQEHLRANLPLITALGGSEAEPRRTHTVVCLDSDWSGIATHPPHNPTAQVQATNLAYVIYTSGSTGQPKGVLIEHQNVLALLHGFEQIAPRRERLVGVALCPYSFDVSVWEVFSPLCFGGALHVLPPEIAADPSQLVNYLTHHAVTSAYIPPLVLGAVIEQYEQSQQRWSLERLLVGVEPIKQRVLQRFLAATPQLRIVNGYGPTECTICSTFFAFTEATEPERATPIGKAVAGYQVYLLDADQQLSPAGIAGELYIGGAGVGRGYLKRPELTAERFLEWEIGDQRPVSSCQSPARLYKTGDLGRWLPDGNIEFLGRMDQQVKIRGFRIELGEIEAVLQQHPAALEAVVVAHIMENGERRLVAYVVTKPEIRDLRSEIGDQRFEINTDAENLQSISVATISNLQSSDLRSYLQQRLPDYMVPTAFVLLDTLPLTPNGKLDRKALPAPELSALSSNTTFVPPRTPTERALADIWCAVLGIKQVGRHDNFFDLGGHSLLATQVVSRIRHTLAIDLSLRTLFENATIATLSAALEQTTGRHELRSIPLADRSQSLPLSYAQERLWFLDRLERERNVYNMPFFLRLRGRLDVAALERSLQAVVCRHESLRTTFAVVDGRPIQCIQPAAFTLPLIDLSALSANEQTAAINRLVMAEVQHVFDLAQGPLFRATLVWLGDQAQQGESHAAPAHLLLINLHHIIADGWSMQVFNGEVAALYHAFAQGQPSPLADLSLQYADFALWQRTWLAEETMATQLAYWQERLAGAPPLLTLPTDRPRPAVQTHPGARYFFSLPAALGKRLQALSVDANATLFMTLLAAFKVLLMRYSGQTDIVVGSPIANRNHLALEPLIGFFVNNLVLRSDLSGDLTFRELLAQIKSTTLDAYRHQDVPFGKVVEHLQPERNLSHWPLFQVAFDLLKRTFLTINLPGLTVENVEAEYPIAKSDLKLTILEDDIPDKAHTLPGSIEYNTDLFDRTTIVRMAGHFQTLLQGIMDNPQQSIHTLPLLSPAERQQILVDWNDTAPKDGAFTSGSGQCFHHLFEEQVARTPAALAVVFDSGAQGDVVTLTYHELNQRANQLAHHLHTLGVAPEILVGLCVERSPEMIIALLAILKAGGAYVPLDPAYPAERLAFMLADSQVPLIVTQQKFVTALPPCAASFVCLDTLTLDDQPTTNPDTPMTSAHLAYIIYTSGSTGKPKGVLIEHRGLCNTSDAQVQAFGVGPQDRHLLFFSLSFDGCTADVILALRVGAALYLAPQQEIMPGEPLHRFLQKHAISTLILTPSALAPVPATDLPALRTVIVAGETCSAELVARWGQNRKFLNLYGATEASIFSTVAVCTNDGKPPSVGRPVLNNQIYILDNRLQPVPVGLPGEIYIGGIGAARGYHNRPDLNQTRFITNPFGPGRLYKTGDLGRYRVASAGESPEIEFIERIDNQVKLRGFRIELDEIAAVLGQHPHVQEAVVVARTEENGHQRLVAYVVTRGETDDQRPVANLQSPISSRQSLDLHTYLQTKLPDYMIPSAFVLLNRLPLTVNGKVDRSALPLPTVQVQYVAPKNELERQLTAVWQAALQVDKVGVDDNFFELGGHSLLVVELQSQLRELYQREIAITDLFQYPTISALASYLRRANDGQSTGQQANARRERVKLHHTFKAKEREQRELRRKSRRGEL